MCLLIQARGEEDYFGLFWTIWYIINQTGNMLRIVTNRYHCAKVKNSFVPVNAFSTLRDKVQSEGAAKAINNEQKGNDNNKKSKISFDIKPLSSINARPSNPFMKNESGPSLGSSLRDSLRKIEQQGTPKPKVDPISVAAAKQQPKRINASDVGSDILKTIAGNTNSLKSAIPQIEKEPATPKEKKFNQKQTHINHKRNELEVKTGFQSQKIQPNAAAGPAPAPTHNHNHQHNHRQHIHNHNNSPAPSSNNNNNNYFNNKFGKSSNNNNNNNNKFTENVDQESNSFRSSLQTMRPSPSSARVVTAAVPAEPEVPKPSTIVKEVTISGSGITLRDLAGKMSLKISDVKAKLIEMGELEEEEETTKASSSSSSSKFKRRKKAATYHRDPKTKEDDNIVLDADVAELVILEFGFISKRLQEKGKSMANAVHFHELSNQMKANVEESHLVKRNPIVSIMGHVDHGKTTLLDALRSMPKGNQVIANATKGKGGKGNTPAVDAIQKIAGTEAGGITQKLSAFSVALAKNEDERVVFLDTPGHAAFAAMRGQGALATDIVVLVIAMDDGLQPQTLEAIRCAKDAKCAIVVALNKCDRYPIANERERRRARLLADLAQQDVLTEEYGGDVQVIEVAGKTGEGMTSLVESLLIQAEVMELKACNTGLAEAIILDACIEKGRGIVAEVLVKWGSLSVGDPIVVGCSFGRIKSLTDDSGKSIKQALPSQPVRILGLRSMPNTGSELLSVESEQKAKEIADRRIRLHELKMAREQQQLQLQQNKELKEKESQQQEIMKANKANEKDNKDKDKEDGNDAPKPIVLPSLGVILKADGLGSLEALKTLVNQIVTVSKEDIQVKILDASVGEVTMSDIERASTATDSLVLAFNVNTIDTNTKRSAKQLDVIIHSDEVIYRLEEELINKIYWILPKQKNMTLQVCIETLCEGWKSRLL